MPKSQKKKLYTATFTHDGKRYYIRSAKSQKDADRRAYEKERDLKEGRVLLDENTMFQEYAEKWVKVYKSNTVSGPVAKAYDTRIKHYLTPSIGHIKLKDIRPIYLQQILNEQVGKSKNHCEKLRHTMRQIFAQAVRDKLIHDNPATDLTLPKATNGTHRSITPEERAAILSVASTHRFGFFVKTLLWCGLRPQEAAALQWSDIDQINHRICVNRALKADNSIGEPKTQSGARDVPIPDCLWTEFESRISKGINDYVFLNTRGERHSRTTLKRAWDSFMREVDIALGAETEIYHGCRYITKSVRAKDLTLYCMRHTYCTDLEAAGVPINVAKYLMGHSSIEMTARIYTHMRPDTLENATSKINQFITDAGATVGATRKGYSKSFEVVTTGKSDINPVSREEAVKA